MVPNHTGGTKIENFRMKIDPDPSQNVPAVFLSLFLTRPPVLLTILAAVFL